MPEPGRFFFGLAGLPGDFAAAGGLGATGGGSFTAGGGTTSVPILALTTGSRFFAGSRDDRETGRRGGVSSRDGAGASRVPTGPGAPVSHGMTSGNCSP